MKAHAAAVVTFAALGAAAEPVCSATFTPVTASAWVEAARPGWNLGNTLDAVPDEGSWNNPPVQPSTFDVLKNAGFKAVRIPATYNDHFVSGSPDWTINETWLQRVSDVVDEATARGLYVLTNMHHDSWEWADVSQANANQTEIQEKFYKGWQQIAAKLACKSSLLALEPINEPPGTTADDAANLDKLNNLFLKAVSESGGFNSQRVVTLSGLGMDVAKITSFTRPTNISNPWAFQFHYYSPYDFIFGAWGKTVWGSDADKAAVTADFESVRGNFTDVPVIVGEYSASQLTCEAAGRWKWTDHVAHTAKRLDFATFMWDNGLDNLARETGVWRDPVEIDIVMNTIQGANNSLADSTTDINALSQNSSAYIYHKVGDPVTDVSLPFILNGNNFASFAVAGAPLLAADYSISGPIVTFTAAFLSNYVSPTAEPGTKVNITVEFTAGAGSQIEIVQWGVPVISTSTSAASATISGNDLWIPIEWKGLHKVAAVRIAESDGTYLVDDWTQWLPALQQGRGTSGNQWSFDSDRLTITSSALQAVIAAGKNTTFTFEFYPRAEGNGNYVNYTLTV